MNFTSNKPNQFDNLTVNVKGIYKRYPLSFSANKWKESNRPDIAFFRTLYKQSLIPLPLRSGLWYLFHRLELDIAWLEDFKLYWRELLGGVTLWGPHDFYFLRNIYRLKFQHSQITDTKSTKSHLRAWQAPTILYQLLDMVYRQSIFNDLRHVQLYRRYAQPSNAALLEFGCGTAPLATTYLEFFGTSKTIYISDIETIFFHYAAFKFRNLKNVIPYLLLPEKKFMPLIPVKVGAIFCFTVYEHLHDPLAVTKKFYDLLEDGGLLIFDYLKSEGKGMDTKIALRDRNKVLRYIESHFTIVHGELYPEGEAKAVVARKHA